jgi:hypothetical protein
MLYQPDSQIYGLKKDLKLNSGIIDASLTNDKAQNSQIIALYT